MQQGFRQLLLSVVRRNSADAVRRNHMVRRGSGDLHSRAAPSLDEALTAPPILRPALTRRDASNNVVGHRMVQRRNAIAHHSTAAHGNIYVGESPIGEPMTQQLDTEARLTDLSEELSEGVRTISRKLSAQSAENLDSICAICLCVIGEGEDATCMPCDAAHPYHVSCLHAWLGRKPECPVCRWTMDEDSTSQSLKEGLRRAQGKRLGKAADQP